MNERLVSGKKVHLIIEAKKTSVQGEKQENLSSISNSDWKKK